MLSWEGPGTELRDWKHYISDWTKIDEIEKNTFILGLTKEDRNKFFTISNQELNEVYEMYAFKIFAEEYKNDLKKRSKSITEEPFYIHTLFIYLKLVNKKNSSEVYEITFKNNPYW